MAHGNSEDGVKVRTWCSILGLGLLVAVFAAPLASASPKHSALPQIGTMAPAFQLLPFAKKSKSREQEHPEAIQLDDHCGIHPDKTKAVLVLFINEEHMGDLTLASGWSRKYQRDGLEVLGISLVKNPTVFSDQVIRAGLRFPVLDDRHSVVATRYGVPKAPFTFLLDANCLVMGMKDNAASYDKE